MKNRMMNKRSNTVIWLAVLAISFNLLIVLISFYTLSMSNRKFEETLQAVGTAHNAHEMLESEKNTLLNINNLSKVNEFNDLIHSNIKNIIQLLDMFDKNITEVENSHTKSNIIRESTLKYQQHYLESIFIIEELIEIKLKLEEQGKIIIDEVADYVQDKFGAHKTNKDFQILQRLNTSMRIWINATQIRLHQKEYIQTRKEKTIHSIRLNFDAMKKDMLFLRELADNDFEKLKTKRFMGAAMKYEISSNRWLKMNQQLNSLLEKMQLQSDNVLEQSHKAIQQSMDKIKQQTHFMGSVLLVILLLSILTILFFVLRVLRKKDA
ncbi:MAG: hypothetical protein KZQ83_16145 [gamma proteobacterium symbiont of Taylorina sp.]|nr:hypothetical protein [gamma proteobacterium symbiont of Taylorina sp.]